MKKRKRAKAGQGRVVMVRFVLVGDGYPAAQVAATIARYGILSEVWTDTSEMSPVSAIAQKFSCPTHHAPALKDGAIPVNADWLVNINSAVLLPGSVLDRFPGRALNAHNGPLPEYAGLHVTQWAIRHGKTTFAATIHMMERKVDAGAIVDTEPFPIKPTDTGLGVFMASFKAATIAMQRVIMQIVNSTPLQEIPQEKTLRRVYRHKDALDGVVDWSQNAKTVVNFIRAGDYRPLTSPSYTAKIIVPGCDPIYVYRAEEVITTPADPGILLTLERGMPLISCNDHAVRITSARYKGTPVPDSLWESLPLSEMRSDRQKGRTE